MTRHNQSFKNSQSERIFERLNRISQIEKCDKRQSLAELAKLYSENKSSKSDYSYYEAYKSVSELYLEISEDFFFAENESLLLTERS